MTDVLKVLFQFIEKYLLENEISKEILNFFNCDNCDFLFLLSANQKTLSQTDSLTLPTTIEL